MNNHRLNLLPAHPPDSSIRSEVHASRSQDWSLDALGNWDSVTDETRTASLA